jgi:sugar phosphate isomerase/epimerase
MKENYSYSRRQFIQQTAGLSLGLGLMGTLPGSQAAEPDQPWMVSCRDAHLKSTGKPDCWSALKDIGAGGVEIAINEEMQCPDLFHPTQKYDLSQAAGVESLRKDAAASGARITAFLMHNQFENRLDPETAWVRKVIETAVKLGVTVVRIDVAPRTLAKEAFLPIAIKTCRQFCEAAQGTKVRFGIENHGRVTNDPTFLDQLFEGVGSPNLGLTLDACNFYWFGHPLETLYPIYEKYASRVFHTHCKGLKYPKDKKNVRRAIGWEYGKYSCPVYDGDIDYKKVAQILKKAGYLGDLCLENECLPQFPENQRPAILKKEISWLKNLA